MCIRDRTQLRQLSTQSGTTWGSFANGEETTMRHRLASALLLSLVLSQFTFGQSSNASVGGFVQDKSHATIPGSTIAATTTETGVVTTALTNDSGTYDFPSLLPGTYKLSATLTGFRPHIYNDVKLGANTAARYNFSLEVGGLTQAIEV